VKESQIKDRPNERQSIKTQQDDAIPANNEIKDETTVNKK
jgi:hypothetical protein